jgi:hypothetical protein
VKSTVLPLLAAVASLLLSATPAHALPAGVRYHAFVDQGFAGTLDFELDSWIADGACRYVATVSPGDGVPAELCVFDEATWLGFFGCAENAQQPVPGIVVLTPGQFCQLYDAEGQDNLVFSMLLGESADGSLDGIVQFTAATNTIAAFHAAPVLATGVRTF